MSFERHPWNTAFEWPPHRRPFRIVSEEQARALHGGKPAG
jgi:hypothetical protein